MAMQANFSFARHTTIGCGGTAALAVSPTNEKEAEALILFLHSEHIPHCFLGAGANVLPSDGFYNGVVVRFRKLAALLREGDLVYAGAGVTGGALCRFARGECLGGFEPFTGIPMTVGGGVVMNAGVSAGHFCDVVTEVVGIENGKVKRFKSADCLYAEKSSIFQSGIAVVGALLRGEIRPPAEIEKRTAEFRSRRAHLPKGRSMGCVFVNPAGDSAGRIIESCGLRGYRLGRARVSEIHANFILNEGGRADDVSGLIRYVQEAVRAKTGILLREEIRRIP